MVVVHLSFICKKKYKLHILANDKFKPLYNFWNICKTDKDKLCEELYKKINTVGKQKFNNIRKQIMNETNNLEQSIMYFIINRCSFSGATLSGGFSLESSKKRFTKSSIDRIKKLDLSNVEIYNLDFEEFINTYGYENNKNTNKKNNNENNNENNKNTNILFLDPPYYLKKASNLYGNNGDMHENFDHERLYKCLITKKNWLMTYNNCDYIKEIYSNFKIIETCWSYGMNKSKKSSEIIIIG